MFDDEVEQEWAVPGVPRPSAPAAAPVLSPQLRAYAEALAALAAVDPAVLEPAQAVAELAFLFEQDRVVQALRLRRLADAHTRRLHELEDAPTTASWLRRHDVEVDRAELALAKRLPQAGAVQQAVLAQQITVRTATVLTQALAELRRHVDRPDGLIDGQDGEAVVRAVVVDGVLSLAMPAVGGLDEDDPALRELVEVLTRIAEQPAGQLVRLEQALLVLAEHVPAVHLPGAVEQIVCAVLPVQLQDRADRAHEERGLRLVRKPDGGWTVRRGELDEETGELLMTVLAAARATDPDAPEDTAAHVAQHDPDSPAPAPRSRAQQDHDALKLALRRLLDSGALGSRAKQAPHLGVTIALSALLRVPGAMPAVSTVTGAPLSLRTVTAWLPDSRITRYVLGLGGRVLETSHTERTLKHYERRILSLHWGGRCAAAGCAHPPDLPLVPHHLTPWRLTGTTSLADSVPLCQSCHAALHRGTQLRLRDGTTASDPGTDAA